MVLWYVSDGYSVYPCNAIFRSITYEIMKSSLKLLSLINQKKIPWWVEIHTTIPRCTYFFGPFDSVKEAKQKQTGYVDDLVQEKAWGITVEIKQCQPTFLTVFEARF